MIGFYIKKSFFDGWDNLISIVLVNVCLVGVLAIGYGAYSLFQVNIAVGILALLVWYVFLHICLGGVAFFAKEYAWYKRPSFADFWTHTKEALPYSLNLAWMNAVLILLMTVVIPFYMSMNSIIGTIIVALLFWITIISIISLMYFLPVCAQLRDTPLKALKKSFILFLDNVGFSIFLFFYTIFNAGLSIVTALLVPGASSILLSHQIALKLLMYKYDYLEENPETDRKHIPWSVLFLDEREKVGQRSLKGMIFPWKE